MTDKNIFYERGKYSSTRLDDLRASLKKVPTLVNYPELTIFAAGSYARLEASQYSDIDLFFLDTSQLGHIAEQEVTTQDIFKDISQKVTELGFPKLSSNSDHIKILHLHDMTSKLGGRCDDFENHFTSRMLLLLESHCLYQDSIYKYAINNIIECYFRDYPNHEFDFRPVFLANDIMRYWKTLCLNLEHKRYKKGNNEEAIIKHKVKNFKLKFSRMTTCFATLALLPCYDSINQKDIAELVYLTPRQRLQKIGEMVNGTEDVLNNIFDEYRWFLELTGLSTDDLRAHFKSREERKQIFRRANEFGSKIYELLQLVDASSGIMRYLVI